MSFADQAIHELDRLSAVILDDAGDGPTPHNLAAAAKTARDAVAQLAVPALTQLGGLISGVADSLVSGAVEWNTSLGGTLMAAVDDLRHLAGRPFTDEDSEHLSHRASELQPFVKRVESGERRLESELKGESKVEQALSTLHPPLPAAPDAKIVPISDLFYADAGPHIVSGGTPAAAASRSDLLGKGIDALDNLVMKPIAKPVTFGAMEIVPVETLIYRGRAALERAAALREQIKASGGVASQSTLDEMYDLIGLALKD